MKNIGKAILGMLLIGAIWTNAQADSFTVSVMESDGITPKPGGTAVAGRYYPMTVTNSNGSYTGTYNLALSTNAPDGGVVPQVCSTPTPGNCAATSACQNADSSRPTDFSGGVANLCLVMPDVGRFTVSMADGPTVGSGPELRAVPSYFEPVLPSPSVFNRSELTCTAIPLPDYTYIGETLIVKFSLIARNESGATTSNYSGAAFSNAISDTAHWIDYDTNGSMGLRFVGAGYPAGLGADNRISISSPSAPWNNGQGDFQVTLKLSRNANSEGPYNGIAIGIRPKDADGVGLRDTDFDLDADNSGINERKSVGTTKLYYGRLKIFNAYGSDVLALPVSVQAQRWNGTGFVDFADNCTPLAGGLFTLAQVGTLPQPSIDPDTGVVGGGTLDVNGKGRIALKKPSAAITGKAIAAIKTRPDNAATPPPIVPGLDSYLPGLGTGTFGVYRSGPVLYRRELHY